MHEAWQIFYVAVRDCGVAAFDVEHDERSVGGVLLILIFILAAEVNEGEVMA